MKIYDYLNQSNTDLEGLGNLPELSAVYDGEHCHIFYNGDLTRTIRAKTQREAQSFFDIYIENRESA